MGLLKPVVTMVSMLLPAPTACSNGLLPEGAPEAGFCVEGVGCVWPAAEAPAGCDEPTEAVDVDGARLVALAFKPGDCTKLAGSVFESLSPGWSPVATEAASVVEGDPTVPSPEAPAGESFGFFWAVLLAALKTSRGKSATAMLMFPISPSSADEQAVIGSHGSSSVLYSRDRNLRLYEP